MADEIDAQEQLAEVHALITDCETTATEIENQFGEFEGVLAASESKTEEVTANLDAVSEEVIAQSNKFHAEVTDSVAGILTRVNEFTGTMEEVLGTSQDRSNALFAKLQELDTAHGEIQEKINENASHMSEIFQQLSGKWTSVTEALTAMQEERDGEIDSDVRQLAEQHTSEQTEAQQETINQGVSEYEDEILANVNQHVADVSDDFTQSLVSGVQSLVDQGREQMEEGGGEFMGMRLLSVDDMFTNAKNLHSAVEGVMGVMTGTVTTTSDVADTVVDAMDQTNIGLNQLMEAVENLLSLLGGLSLD